MTRWDLTGLFWDDYVAPRVPKIKHKATPPDPVWLADDYLPDLPEACAYQFNLMSDDELIEAAAVKDKLVWDTEFYPNYALWGFKNARTGKVVYDELHSGEQLDERRRDKLLWILRNFTLIGFNDSAFDLPMAMAILAGFSTERLVAAANSLISGGEYMNGLRPQEFYKVNKIKPIFVDHIDLIELTPLGPGLKTCAGRLHAPRMADLPYIPGKILTPDQITVLRWYWVNDLDNTHLLFNAHKTAIELRELLSQEYSVDVRSKSDPQIADAVIRKEIQRMTGQKYLERAKIEPGRKFKFNPAPYLQYESETMQWVLNFIREQVFVIDDYGSPTESKELSDLSFNIGNSTYQMGIGGLHSKEKRVVHMSNDDYELSDNDVTSYYPALIIQQGMYPPNIGPAFLTVFKRIFDRRIAAKRAGDKATAETLKIVLNGTFGKTAERGGYSVVYYPEMMIQTTLGGQLALLMLIEKLELNGIEVVSANTDGIMVKCPRTLLDRKAEIMRWWQDTTALGLEDKIYKAIYSRDINNYIALYEKPDTKETGAWQYAKAIGAYRKTLEVYPLKWNPTADICNEAVIQFLATGKPVEETIRECDDVRKFIEVRTVRGGACKAGVYFGKAIRWYYSTEEVGELINAKNGHSIARSTGARACMRLPSTLPPDLDYPRYIERALGILSDFEPKATKVKTTEDEGDEEKAA